MFGSTVIKLLELAAFKDTNLSGLNNRIDSKTTFYPGYTEAHSELLLNQYSKPVDDHLDKDAISRVKG